MAVTSLQINTYDEKDCSGFVLEDTTDYSSQVADQQLIQSRNISALACNDDQLACGATTGVWCLNITSTPSVGVDYVITWNGKRYAYTTVASDIIVAGVGISAAEALNRTEQNIFNKLFNLIKEDFECDPLISASVGCTDTCRMIITTKQPGFDIIGFSFSGPNATVTVETRPLGNWPLLRTYLFDFTSLTPPFTLTSASIRYANFDGTLTTENLIDGSVTGTGADIPTALVALASELSLETELTWSSSGNALYVEKSPNIHISVSGTDNSGNITLYPELQSTENPKHKVTTSEDQVADIDVATYLMTEEYYSTFFTIGTVAANTYYDITLTNLVSANPIFVRAQGDAENTATTIQNNINLYLSAVELISPRDVYALAQGNLVRIYVRSGYLSQIGQTSGSVSVSVSVTNGTLTTSPVAFALTLTGGISIIAYNDLYGYLCSAKKAYVELLVDELTSGFNTKDYCLPQTTRIANFIEGINYAICNSDKELACCLLTALKNVQYQSICETC